MAQQSRVVYVYSSSDELFLLRVPCEGVVCRILDELVDEPTGLVVELLSDRFGEDFYGDSKNRVRVIWAQMAHVLVYDVSGSMAIKALVCDHGIDRLTNFARNGTKATHIEIGIAEVMHRK